MLSALLNQLELVYGVEDQVVHGAKASSNIVSNIRVAHVLILVAVFNRNCDFITILRSPKNLHLYD